MKKVVLNFLAVVAGVVVLGLNAPSVLADEAYRVTVVGVVKALPGSGRAANELLVKHEEIPNYRDSSGEVVGMMAMTMPFYLAPQVDISALKVGDKVEMVVEQHLAPQFSELVVAIKRAD